MLRKRTHTAINPSIYTHQAVEGGNIAAVASQKSGTLPDRRSAVQMQTGDS
ncbi:MAG: hypothetical protein ACJ8DI_06450 [Ktedonobacteraceae bacterium]